MKKDQELIDSARELNYWEWALIDPNMGSSEETQRELKRISVRLMREEGFRNGYV